MPLDGREVYGVGERDHGNGDSDCGGRRGGDDRRGGSEL